MSNIFKSGGSSTVPPWIDFSGSVTLTYSGNGPSTISVFYCEYMQFSNKLTHFRFSIQIVTAVVTLSSDTLSINLPINSADVAVAVGCGDARNGGAEIWSLGLDTGASVSNPLLIWDRLAGGTNKGPFNVVTASDSGAGSLFEGMFIYKSI